MTLLSDLDLTFGADLVVSNTGDINTVTGTIRGQQRVERRLFTNPGSYIFEPNYGAGLPQDIGRQLDIPKMQALCVAQMLLEDVVAKSPIPTVVITQSATDLSSINLTLSYTDQPTNTPVVLSYTVS